MLITKTPVQTHFQTLDEPAHSVKEAVQKLAQNAQRMMIESEDEVCYLITDKQRLMYSRNFIKR